jgi:hypothetical protein
MFLPDGRARRLLKSAPAWAAALLLLCACAASRGALGPVSAGTLAARLANDRCQKAYGQRPFTPDDFEAVLDQGRWHWGNGDVNAGKPAEKVDGFEVNVSFDRAGGKKKVSVRIPEE